jgi:translation elongation factor EF-1beta
MKTKLICCLFLLSFSLYSCKKKPTDDDISKKILLEYICADNAKIDGLKIIDEKETQSLFGLPAIQFTVSGFVEWIDGCDETFGMLPRGYKEPFTNKLVTLVKSNDGWQ